MPAVLRDVTRVDRSKVAVEVGVRCSVGVAIALVVGELTGHATQGVTAAVGAINGGFASLQGTYRTRAAVVVIASAGSALAAFVAMTAGHVLGVDLVITAAVGFFSGLLVALGQSAAVVGIQALVGLVVFSQFALTPLVALREAGLIFAGGILQMLLVVVLWPLRRFPEERRALSDAFDRLASYAAAVPENPSALMDVGAFTNLGDVLRDPQPLAGGTDVAALQSLGSQAERIRLELAAVARNLQRLRELEDGGQLPAQAVAAMTGLLKASDKALAEAASALREMRVPTRWEDERGRFETALSQLEDSLTATADPVARFTLESSYTSAQALAGQLRSVVRLAAVPAGGDPQALEEAAVTGRAVRRGGRATVARDLDWMREQVATLRANLDIRSEAFRHGVRVGGALVVGVAVSHFFKQGHRYWLPLTVMIVLRPDFSSTITRGVSRVVGTIAGAGLVTLAVAELKPGHLGLTVMVVLFYLAAIALLLANYAIYSLCIASLVVTLLAFTGQPEVSLAGERSLYTVLGAFVALVAYLAWPTWAAVSLPERLSNLFSTEGRYGADVLAAWADPAKADRAKLQQARLAARLARSNAEAAVERSVSEPTRRELIPRERAAALLNAVRSYVQAVLSLHAQLPANGSAWPEARKLSEQVSAAFRAASDAVSGVADRELPPLRATQLELRRRAGLDDGGSPDVDPDPQAVLLVSETDQIVDAINTVGHLAGVRPPP